jgi:peptide/nickel transport system substrate-binding protein
MQMDLDQSQRPRGPGRRRAIVFASVAALGGCTGPCGASSPASDPEATAPRAGPRSHAARELVLGMADEPATLDPAYVSTTSGQQLSALVHRGLVRFDANGRPRPDLATALPTPVRTGTSVRVSWTLRPRRWEDGEPVTAEDVRFAWRLERRPRLEMVNGLLARAVEDIDVRGPRRFDAVWPRPRPELVAPGTHTVLPAHAYPPPDADSADAGQGRYPLSNGPYRVAAWRPGVEARFEPNPHWAGPGPVIATIRVRFYANEDALFLALMRGEVQAVGEAAGLGGSKAKLVEERMRERYAVHRTDGGLWVHLIMDLEHPVTGELAFRRVLNERLDRSALARVYGRGAAAPARGLFPRNHPGRVDGPSASPSAAERARVAELSRSHPTLDLFLASESRRGADLVALLGEELAALGFELRVRATPFDVLNARLEAGEVGGMVLYGWRIRPDWDANSILHSKGRQNFSGFSDPEVDAQLEAAQTGLDSGARAEALRGVARRYRARLPSVPLLFGQAISVRPRWLRGWQPTGTTTPVTWNAEMWSGSPSSVDAGVGAP